MLTAPFVLSLTPTFFLRQHARRSAGLCPYSSEYRVHYVEPNKNWPIAALGLDALTTNHKSGREKIKESEPRPSCRLLVARRGISAESSKVDVNEALF